MADTNDFNAGIIEEFRANAGKVGGPFEGASVVLLTTVGAKSGKVRVNPVVYRTDGGRMYVFASKAGAPTNPDWYHNILADPNITIEVGSDTHDVTATVIGGAERDRIYADQAKEFPGFADYQANTDRIIPVIARIAAEALEVADRSAHRLGGRSYTGPMARERTPGDDQPVADSEPEDVVKASLAEETALPAEDVIGPELDS